MDPSWVKAICTIGHGHQIIFDDSDGDDEEYLSQGSKLLHYAEENVPLLRDRQFKEHFRMCPTTFEDLLRKLHEVTPREHRKGRPEISLEKQVMITLWCLANTESFLSVSTRFGIVKSSCWEILYRTCERILQVNQRYKVISWPSRQRANSIMEAFHDISGFQGIIGCIDGSHVEILAPLEHSNSYYNRNKYHSLLLQVVCDNNKLFTHVYGGEPGSIHDQKLFEKSDLYADITTQVIQFPNDSYLLGDLAYKLVPYLIVGFKDNGNLTRNQKNFNVLLSKVRVLVENALALLKGRFRRLKRMDTRRLDLICLLMLSACILHNICILNGDMADDILDVQREVERERRLNALVPYNNAVGRMNQIAVAKRRRIMQELDIL